MYVYVYVSFPPFQNGFHYFLYTFFFCFPSYLCSSFVVGGCVFSVETGKAVVASVATDVKRNASGWNTVTKIIYRIGEDNKKKTKKTHTRVYGMAWHRYKHINIPIQSERNTKAKLTSATVIAIYIIRTLYDIVHKIVVRVRSVSCSPHCAVCIAHWDLLNFFFFFCSNLQLHLLFEKKKKTTNSSTAAVYVYRLMPSQLPFGRWSIRWMLFFLRRIAHSDEATVKQQQQQLDQPNRWKMKKKKKRQKKLWQKYTLSLNALRSIPTFGGLRCWFDSFFQQLQQHRQSDGQWQIFKPLKHCALQSHRAQAFQHQRRCWQLSVTVTGYVYIYIK